MSESSGSQTEAPGTAQQPLLVGIDVGTTNIKAVVYQPDGQAVARASESTPTHYPRPGWAYYEPEELWQHAVHALRSALARVEDPKRIQGVAVTGVGEAGVPLDAHGQPTDHAIAWFDRRTQPQVDWLAQNIGQDQLFASSGLSLQPIFGLCKVLWFKENRPEAFARTVRWLHIADYVAFRLCGGQATDYSLASRTLALDLRRRVWNTDLLRAVGVSPEIYPPLVESGTPIGRITEAAAQETGLPSGVTVAAGGHDHVCGAFASGVVDPGAMLNSLGTAEALFLPLASPITDPALGTQGYTQGAHVVPHRYYVFAGQYTAGASVEWLRSILGETAGYDGLITEAAATPPGSLGVMFLPHLRLANPPFDDPRSRGAFIGLTTDATRGALVRAVFEGLAYESRMSLEPLLRLTGLSPSAILAIGGGTRNSLLLQIKASVLSRRLTVASIEEATTLGAALLGGIGAAVYADAADALRTRRCELTEVAPQPADVPVYDRCYRDVYSHLYASLRELNHALAILEPTNTGARAG